LATILIIAGPNGAGKTTFANQWFAEHGESWAFVNADEIAREPELIGLTGGERDLRAGRLMLQRIAALVSAGLDFGVETTLSSRRYAKRIPDWRQRGYRIVLVYIRLPNVDASIARVAHRVAGGGHSIPEPDIRRRFGRSLRNLENLYKPLVDVWEVWDSRDGSVILAERSLP
jgi:predicted ABC-type ATPase